MPGPIFLTGDSVELRTIERDDIETVQRWINHPEIRRYIHEFRLPYTREEYEEWVREEHGTSDRVDLLVCVDGEPVGRARLVPLDDGRRCANLAFMTAPDHQDSGYATQAAGLLVGFGFGELRLHRIEAKVLAPNQASQHVLETLGFVREGRRRERAIADGGYVDEVFYGLLRAEWEATDDSRGRE